MNEDLSPLDIIDANCAECERGRENKIDHCIAARCGWFGARAARKPALRMRYQQMLDSGAYRPHRLTAQQLGYDQQRDELRARLSQYRVLRNAVIDANDAMTTEDRLSAYYSYERAANGGMIFW